MQVGRINLTLANETFQQIGKVVNGKFIYVYNGINETWVTSGYEVLTCLPKAVRIVDTEFPCGMKKHVLNVLHFKTFFF